MLKFKGFGKAKKRTKIRKPSKREIVGEFIRVQDVLGFFKYNLNPSFIEAKIEKATASNLKQSRVVPFMWVFAIAIIFIAGAIAYVLISGQSGCESCYNDLKNCYQACSPAANVITQQSSSGSAGISIT